MRSVLIVFRFPPFQFSRQVFFVPEVSSSIELFRVCLVAPLYLAVTLRASGRDMPMRNAEIRKMPSELGSERRVIVSLDFLDCERKMLTNFPEEVDGRLGVVVVVDT
jgi:hypothetical protein